MKRSAISLFARTLSLCSGASLAYGLETIRHAILSDSGERTCIIIARRMIMGEVLKERNGLGFVIQAGKATGRIA